MLRKSATKGPKRIGSEARAVLDGQRQAQIKDGAVQINLARDHAVDIDALVEALAVRIHLTGTRTA